MGIERLVLFLMKSVITMEYVSAGHAKKIVETVMIVRLVHVLGLMAKIVVLVPRNRAALVLQIKIVKVVVVVLGACQVAVMDFATRIRVRLAILVRRTVGNVRILNRLWMDAILPVRRVVIKVESAVLEMLVVAVFVKLRAKVALRLA